MKHFLLPAILNTGRAPPAPQGATRYAPRLGQYPAKSIHDPFTKMPRANTPLVLLSYYLPQVGMPGFVFAPISNTPLTANPYVAAAQSSTNG